MPSAYLKSLADKHDIPKDKLEIYWDEAKKAADESYDEKDDKYWGTVTKIFKNKINAHLGLNEGIKSFKKFLQEKDKKIEDDVTKEVIKSISKKVGKSIEDELLDTFKDRIINKIKSELEDADTNDDGKIDKDEVNKDSSENDEEDSEEKDNEIDSERDSKKDEPEEQEKEKSNPDENAKDSEGDSEGEEEIPEEPEESEEEKLEKSLSREETFLIKIAKDNNIELKELVDLWKKSKKECKKDPDDNGYWSKVDKIFKKKFKEKYNIEL